MVKNNKINNGGFTIAEVVVTMGALGVMALVFMSLSKNFNQLSNETQYAVDKVFYRSFFSKQLAKNDGEYCKLLLENLTYKTSGTDNIMSWDKLNSKELPPSEFNNLSLKSDGTNLIFGKDTIKSVQLLGSSSTGLVLLDDPSKEIQRFKGYLNITMERSYSPTRKKSIPLRPIAIVLHIDTFNEALTQCHSPLGKSLTSSTANEVCSYLGADFKLVNGKCMIPTYYPTSCLANYAVDSPARRNCEITYLNSPSTMASQLLPVTEWIVIQDMMCKLQRLGLIVERNYCV